MSVSSRSPKAVMYAEIERLRALLDQRDNQIASLEEKVLRRDAKIEEIEQRWAADYEDLARALDKAERERNVLRALLDQRDNQIASLEEKVLHREAKIEELSAALDQQEQHASADYEDLARALDKAERERDELRAQLSAPRSEPELLDRSTRNLMMKRLAITCKASVKWVDGQGFRQYKDGRWVAIPTHTVEFVAKGISQ